MDIQNGNGAKNTARKFIRRTNNVKNQETDGVVSVDQASAELKAKKTVKSLPNLNTNRKGEQKRRRTKKYITE